MYAQLGQNDSWEYIAATYDYETTFTDAGFNVRVRARSPLFRGVTQQLGVLRRILWNGIPRRDGGVLRWSGPSNWECDSLV